jgi:hypothetical protein
MTLTLFKGNRLPLLQDTITVSGTAYDLTGSTVLFSMRIHNSATTKVSGATATIVSAPAGTISYAWASTDVDTVGSYLGWWTVNNNGKSQDTPEFSLAVTEHAPASIEIVYPVASDGTTSIYQGDAYLAANNRQLQYELEVEDAPLLSGTTVVYRIEGENHYTMTVVGKDAAYLELTSAQTTALAPGSYRFQIQSTSGGNAITLMRSNITVTAAIASP